MLSYIVEGIFIEELLFFRLEKLKAQIHLPFLTCPNFTALGSGVFKIFWKQEIFGRNKKILLVFFSKNLFFMYFFPNHEAIKKKK